MLHAVNTDAVEYATVEALLAGSVEPPAVEEDFDDLTMPAAEEIAEAIIEMAAEDDDVIIIPTVVAPRIVAERKDRVSALFADKIAAERAKEMLGDSFAPIVEGMSTAPKKVAEKVYNGLCYLAERGKLSKFTSIALEILMEAEVLTSAELVSAYQANGYSEGTARSQAQQQMTALPILTVASRDPTRKDITTLLLERGDALYLFTVAADRKPGEAPTPAPRAPKKEKVASSDDETLLATSPPPEFEDVPIETAEPEPVIEAVTVEDGDLLADGPTADLVEEIEDLLVASADETAEATPPLSNRAKKRNRRK